MNRWNRVEGIRSLVGFFVILAALCWAPALPAGADPPESVDGGVLFTFHAPDAREVYLAGEFNGWSSTTDLLTKDEEGVWRIIVPLTPGTYQYKFVIDGVWQEDPDNPQSVFCEYLDLSMNEMLLGGIDTTNDYEAVDLRVWTEVQVPAVSEWGMIVLTLLVVTAGSVLLRQTCAGQPT